MEEIKSNEELTNGIISEEALEEIAGGLNMDLKTVRNTFIAAGIAIGIAGLSAGLSAGGVAGYYYGQKEGKEKGKNQQKIKYQAGVIKTLSEDIVDDD